MRRTQVLSALTGVLLVSSGAIAQPSSASVEAFSPGARHMMDILDGRTFNAQMLYPTRESFARKGDQFLITLSIWSGTTWMARVTDEPLADAAVSGQNKISGYANDTLTFTIGSELCELIQEPNDQVRLRIRSKSDILKLAE